MHDVDAAFAGIVDQREALLRPAPLRNARGLVVIDMCGNVRFLGDADGLVDGVEQACRLRYACVSRRCRRRQTPLSQSSMTSSVSA